METRLSHPWQFMYPPLQSHAQGWLEVGEGHGMYWEECGNPLGQPALFVHGGPGAGCRPDNRHWFDPRRYRIVLFDQRGAGRSLPQGRLVANSTGHLVRDMEALQRHLAIDRWLLFGGSWGATLALAYAQQHADRVAALVLRGPFTATEREQEWLYTAQGAATIDPAAWRRLSACAGLPGAAEPLAALAAQLHCGAVPAEQAAAHAWLQWEDDLMALESPGPQPLARPRPRGDSAALAMARIGVHFARHGFFLGATQLLTQSARLAAVPGVIVQGERDLVTPPASAQALHRAWSGSLLRLVTGAGHASSHPAIAQALVAATDFFGAPPTTR